MPACIQKLMIRLVSANKQTTIVGDNKSKQPICKLNNNKDKKMKSIYDEKGLQTTESQKFCIAVEKAVQPILEEYLDQGFSIRDLSHEAQAAVRDCELDHMITIHMENAKRTKVNLKRKKMLSEVAKKHGLTETDWDYGEYEMPGGC